MKLLKGVGILRAKYPVGSSFKYLVFATCKEVNLGITAEDVRQNAGDRLFPLDIYTHTKSGSIKITDASLNMEVLEMMGAGTATTTENVMVNELLTVATDSVTLNADFVAGTVSVLDKNGNDITSAITESAPRTITGLSAYDTQQVKVYYETEITTGVVNSLKYDDEPLYFEVIHTSRFRDPATNAIMIFQTRIYRCRMKGNLEWTFQHGQYAVPVIDAEVLDPGRADKKIVTYSFSTEPAGLSH